MGGVRKFEECNGLGRRIQKGNKRRCTTSGKEKKENRRQ